MLFHTVGYDAPAALVSVHPDHAIVMHAGVVPRRIEQDVPLELRWRQGSAAPVAWCELSLMVGRPMLGNTSLYAVGCIDHTSAVRTFAPGVVGNTTIAASVALDPGDDLWVAVAVGPNDKGWGGGPLRLQGTNWTDPLQAGLVAEIVTPGWRPSQQLGVHVVTIAYSPMRPVAIAMSLP